MSYTFTTAVGDGVTTVFPFSFAGQDNGYLSVSNVNVFVAGTSVPFTIPSNDPNKAYLSSAPPVGAEVLIRRIMPKNVPYTDFARGNPFSQDALNNTNLQQLYVVQELLDGYFPVGYYLKQDLNMGGHRVVNMAPGTQNGDATNWEQLQEVVAKNVEQDDRLNTLESAIPPMQPVRYIRWSKVITAPTTELVPGYPFDVANLYINGLYQDKDLGAFIITGNRVITAETLIPGDRVTLVLGTAIEMVTEYEPYIRYPYQAAGGELTLNTGAVFNEFKLYLNGLRQFEEFGAVDNASGVLTFAEPLMQGDLLLIEYKEL